MTKQELNMSKISYPILNSDIYGNILQFLNLSDAVNFTTVSNDFLTLGEKYLGTIEPIIGDIKLWHKRFPNAIYANIIKIKKYITNEDFEYFRNVKILLMDSNTKVSYKSFVNLKCIQELDLGYFSDPDMRNNSITDNFFESIESIKKLNISYCINITDNGFKHFKFVEILNMSGCNNITSNAFKYLENIKELDISDCNKITDDVFTHLKKIRKLNISCCIRITNNAFKHLEGIQDLNMSYCKNITNDALVHLKNMLTLNITGCGKITDDAFVHLQNIKNLNITNTNLTGECFKYLKSIEKLKIFSCKKITNECFVYIKGIQSLESSCIQTLELENR